MLLIERPPRFLPVETEARVRIFILTWENPANPKLSAVATVPAGAEANALPAALNDAAWTGNHRGLDAILANLPNAVGSACRQVLEGLPHPSRYAPATTGYMPEAVAISFYSHSTTDIVANALDASAMGMGFVVVNSVSESGWPEHVSYTFPEAFEINPSQVDTWWPNPEGARLLDRRTATDDELPGLFDDLRWRTHEARLFSLWTRDREVDLRHPDGWGATQEWVVEFFDLPLSPETNVALFVPTPNWDGGLAETFLTDRNRFTIWLVMRQITIDLESLTAEWGDFDSVVQESMPPVIQSQNKEWWRQLARSAVRLEEAFRLGGEDMVPRTPGEEALLSLATSDSFIDWGMDSLGLYPEMDQQLHQLPADDADGEWDEILGELTGDIDIEIVWEPGYLERANPTDATNQQMGMGDYRPWHRLFDRAVGSELPPLD